MDNLAIHENKLLGVHVKDLLEIFVGSVDEVYQVMRRGHLSRSVGATNMNLESSRSHAIFQITIIQKNLLDGCIKTSKLSLVDLAGSEKVAKSGATGQSLEEAKKINKSLSTLGMVINALTDGKSTHIPYRDSKLTRILQESLGGNARTTLIINCSLCPSNESETLGTLRFGMRAKNIKNKARINSELSSNELKEHLKKAKDTIKLLEIDLASLGNEIVVWRSGAVVPQNEWIRLDYRCSSPSKPSDSNDIIWRSTDSPISENEREGFLAREVELTEQLAEQERESKTHAEALSQITLELQVVKNREKELSLENKNIFSTLTETKLALEKLVYNNKETLITLETLQESYTEKEIELESLKAHVANLEEFQSTAESDWAKQKIRDEKVAQMMNEHDIPDIIENSLSDMLQTENLELKKTVHNLMDESVEYKRQISALEAKNQQLLGKIQTMRIEYENNLEQSIQEQQKHYGDRVEQVICDLKVKLDSQYNSKVASHQDELKELNHIIENKVSEIVDLKTKLLHLSDQKLELENVLGEMRSQAQLHTEDVQSVESLKQIIAQNSSDYETMKQKLIRDLQNRCERVVELEIQVEDIQQKHNVLANNQELAGRQEKLSILHKNLENLSSIQKKLIEQNDGLRKEILVSDRKILAKEERIISLEELLQEIKSRRDSENFAYEQTISKLKEKLKQAKTELSNEATWLQSSKIAKPLRGTGSSDSVNTLSLSHEMRTDKRIQGTNGSWYLSLLKK